MGHVHLTRDKREILGRLLGQGMSIHGIARILGYSPSAICQEIKRSSPSREMYDHSRAQKLAVLRRARASRRGKGFREELLEYVRVRLSWYWSPEQIAERVKLDFPNAPRMRISFKTIYRWLQKAARSKKPNPWQPYVRYLRLKRRGKSFLRARNDQRGRRDDLPSIETRPELVAARTRFGDWEGDLIQGHNRQGYLLTLVERSTNLLLAQQCENKNMETVNQAIISSFQGLPQEFVRTITVDRGKEFYGYEDVEKNLQTKVYFCHPYRPNERGQNEQANGLLRQFFPKHKPITGVTKDDVERAVALINNRPKKKFGYRTTMELLAERGLDEVLSFA